MTLRPSSWNSLTSAATLSALIACGSTALRMMAGSMPSRRGSLAAISLMATNRSTWRHLKPVFHSSFGLTTKEVRREGHRPAVQPFGQHGPGDGIGRLGMDDVVAAGAGQETQLRRHVAAFVDGESFLARALGQRAAQAAHQFDLVAGLAEGAHAVERLPLAAAPALLEVQLQDLHTRPMPE